jgi:hypothetical protein
MATPSHTPKLVLVLVLVLALACAVASIGKEMLSVYLVAKEPCPGSKNNIKYANAIISGQSVF